MLFRRIALIFLIIFAPIAIALSILPNTEKWFKKWWDYFWTLLFAYPFLEALFAMGRVASGIISSSLQSDPTGITGLIIILMSVIAFFIPFFAVGTVVKMSHGVLGKFGSFMNDKNKGFIDRTRKWEGNKVAGNRSMGQAGSRYRDNAFTRPINSALGRTLNGPGSVFNTASGQANRASSSLGASQSLLDPKSPVFNKLLAVNKDDAKVTELLMEGNKNKAAERARARGEQAYQEAIDKGKSTAEAEAARKEWNTALNVANKIGHNSTNASWAIQNKAGGVKDLKTYDSAGNLTSSVSAEEQLARMAMSAGSNIAGPNAAVGNSVGRQIYDSARRSAADSGMHHLSEVPNSFKIQTSKPTGAGQAAQGSLVDTSHVAAAFDKIGASVFVSGKPEASQAIITHSQREMEAHYEAAQAAQAAGDMAARDDAIAKARESYSRVISMEMAIGRGYGGVPQQDAILQARGGARQDIDGSIITGSNSVNDLATNFDAMTGGTFSADATARANAGPPPKP
jgi:hypothetical protein